MIFKLFKNKEKTQQNTVLKNQKNNRKTREKSVGRSMVEMLGVLAIIGVLSIGGISGYTLAMRRYKANEILNIAHKYALTFYTQMETKMRNDPEHYYINDNGVWYNNSAVFSMGGIAFSDSGLGGMPYGVTNMLVDKIATNDSGDFVVLFVYVGDDEALCKTVLTMGGVMNSGQTANCSSKSLLYGYAASIYFIIN